MALHWQGIPNLRAVPRPRHLVYMRANEANLTIGDVLLGDLKREVYNLPEVERTAVRAEWQIDALIDGSKDQLERLQSILDRDLDLSRRRTAKKLRSSLQQTADSYTAILNKTINDIETVLAPSREHVRIDLSFCE